MVNAWSYETEIVTITCGSTNTSPFTVVAQSGSAGQEGVQYWEIRNGYNLKLKAQQSYYITKVEFAQTGDNVETWDKLQKYTARSWVRYNDDIEYYDVITFSNEESTTKVTSITVTYYHVCYGATHHETVPGTCTTKGTAEYWECVCGKKYCNESCTNEVTDMATLATEIDPTNHPDALEEHARVDATCLKDGNVQYWHCNYCHKDFGSEGGKGEAIANVTIPKAQGSHLNLSFVPQKDATCTECGYTMNHYHCSDCGKNYKEEACTTQITEDVTIPAINHKNKIFTDYVAPTTETEGNVAYWYCPDCKKHFGDAACTNELTEWILGKLVNMMHLYFNGTSIPIETEHYMNTAKFNFTDDGDIILTVNNKSVTYDKDMLELVKFSNGTPKAQISANEDPDNKGTYYSTFYSNLESYAVPESFMAYRGEISDDGTKLNLTSVKDGIMLRGEGYILKGTASSGNMNVTANATNGNSGNILLGTDVATTLGANDYAMTLGQYGVGFYPWDGKKIGANKAYMTLVADGTSQANAFILLFDEGTTTGINSVNENEDENENIYNLNGVRVGKDYKGIIGKGGKKYFNK